MRQLQDDFCRLVDEARNLLSQTLETTPLQFSRYLSKKHDAGIWLKREDLSPVRSYKIRGAYSFFHNALHKEQARKFVCASAGNHAQGFAHACRHFGKKGWVFMPVTTPAQKVAGTKSFGERFIEIRMTGDTFEESNHEAIRFCEKYDATFVPPFDNERIIIGQATVAAEIIEQIPKDQTIENIVLPVGGGGLAAGVTTYLQSRIAEEAFIFVEPDGASSLYHSLLSGKREALSEIDAFIEGAAVAQIGEKPFSRLKGFSPDQVVRAPTNGLCETMIEMLNAEGVVLEPAGALAIDALKRLPAEKIRGHNVVCVVSGGNFDFERLPEVRERALKFRGLKKYFILQMPQRPGALKDFLLILGPDDDITRFEYLKKSARNFGSVLIGIETKDPGNFATLTQKMEKSGIRFQDITENEIVASLVV